MTVGEVNNLIVRFHEGQKMMRQMMGSMARPARDAGMRRAQKQGQGQEEGQGRRRPAGRSAAAGAAPGRPPAALGQAGPGQDGNGAPMRGFGGLPGSLADALPDGLPEGLGSDGKLRLPPGLGAGFPPPASLPPGLRGPQGPQDRQPGRRGKQGKKGR